MLKNIDAPAYAYKHFQKHDSILAFFTVYNRMAQQYLTWLFDHPFALYTESTMTGGFLNYCIYCIYGQSRHKISFTNLEGYIGAVNDLDINKLAIDEVDVSKKYLGSSLSDDFLKRILTWNFYKGDGLNFTIPWLKRRVKRFITGDNGKSRNFNHTNDIGIQINGRDVVIMINDNEHGYVIDSLSQIMNNGLLNLPMMYNFSIKINSVENAQ